MIHWTKKDAIEAITTLTNPFEKMQGAKKTGAVLPNLGEKIKEVAAMAKGAKPV